MRSNSLPFRFSLDAIDHVGSRLPHPLVERAEPVGIFFEIAVKGEDQLTAGVSETGQDRLVLTEVASKVDNPHAPIPLVELQARCPATRRESRR